MNLFEKAARYQWRFNSSHGALTVEQLWQLPLSGELSLDAIAVELYGQAATDTRISFVNDVSKDAAAELAGNKLELVKRVIEVKLQEQEARVASVERAEKRKKLIALLADKEDQALQKMTEKQILRALEDLD